MGVLLDEETTEFDPAEMEQAGYAVWDVKPGTYVVFDCIGKDGDCISETWTKFYKEFLPQMGYEADEVTDYEIYYESGRPGLFCELWIPVKKVN
ncbi:MAG: effector binding domain-containing protein [Lachnospiraceae bacterium]|nr:effector binding domain-containing protein [Lachnospiraceae bacterium]